MGPPSPVLTERSPSLLPLPDTKEELLTFPSQASLSRLPSRARIKPGGCTPALPWADKQPDTVLGDTASRRAGRAGTLRGRLRLRAGKRAPSQAAFEPGTQRAGSFISGVHPHPGLGEGREGSRSRGTGRWETPRAGGMAAVLPSRRGRFPSVSTRRCI